MSNPRIIFGVSSSQIYKDDNTSDLVIMNNTAAVMNIGSNENVGIGKVSSSTHKLDIDGSMGIAGHIIPSTTNAYDLGSTTNRFNDLYLDGDSIFIGDSVINDVSGVLSVSGTMQINALNVTGNADIDGTLDVASTATLNALNVTNNVDFDGTLDVAGNAQVASLNTTADADIGANLDVVGTATVGGILTANGAIDANSTSNFSGAMVLQTTLETQGTATLNALVVTANADLNGALDVAGNAQLGSLNVTANADIDGTLNTQGVATFQDQVVVTGAIDANSTSNFQGAMVLQSTLNVASSATAQSLVVTNDADLNGALDVAGTAQLNALNVTNDADLNGALDVAGTAQLNALNVTNDADLNGALNVQGLAEFQANLAVDTDTLFVNASTDRVGVNNAAPEVTLHLSGTDAIVIPVGTTLQRTNVTGAIRYNTDNATFEGYKGTWGSLGGVVDVDQDTQITAEDAAGDDNDQLRFYTAGSERMIVNADGSVGIGVTSSGTYKLELEGKLGIAGDILPKSNETYDLGSNEMRFKDLYLSGSSIVIGDSEITDNSGVLSTQSLKITGASELVGAATIGGILTANANVDINAALDVSGNAQVGSLNATANADIGANLDVVGTANLQNTLTVGGAVDINAVMNVQGKADFQDDLVVDTNKFVVDQSSGFVGIGKAVPAADLDIYKATGAANLNVETAVGAASLSLKASTMSNVTFADAEDNDVGRIQYSHTDNSMKFRTNDVERVYIDNAGNMGVGVAVPAAQLDVASTSKFGGNMDVNAALDVSGNAQVGSLNTTANADIGADLDVVGTANFQSTITAAGHADLNSTMNVQGKADFQDDLVVDTDKFVVDQSTGFVGTGREVPTTDLDIYKATGANTLLIESADNNSVLRIKAASDKFSTIGFADADADNVGQIQYNHYTNLMKISTNATEAININSAQKVTMSADLDVATTSTFGGNMDVNAALDVSGNAQVGSLNTTANADIGANLDVVGTATVGGIFTANGAIDANSTSNFSGAMVLQSTINVASSATAQSLVTTANADIGANLDVVGTANFQSTSAFAGNMDVNAALDVSGTATVNALNVSVDSDLTGALAVGGNTDLNGTLDVASTATVNALNTTANADIGANLDVVGTANFQSTSAFAGNMDVNAALDVSGNAQVGSLNCTAAADIDGTLNVSLASTLQSTLDVQETATVNALSVSLNSNLTGDLTVGGNSEFTGTLNVADNAHVASLNVTGSADIDGHLVIDGDLTVHGTTTTVNTDQVTIEDPFIQLAANNSTDVVDIGFYGKYNDGATDNYTGFFRDANSSNYRLFNSETAPTNTVNTSAATYSHSDLTLGSLNADANIVAQGTAQIVGQATVNSLVVTNDADLNGALDVSGNAQVGSLNVTANADIDGTLDVLLGANFQNTITAAGHVDINSTMDVSGTSTLNAVNVSNNADIDGTLDVQGNANFQSTSAFGGNMDVNADMDVSGTAQIGALNVTNNADLNGALDVAGTAQLNALNVTNAADIDGTLNVSLASTLQSTLEVQSTATVNALNVTNNADINGTLDIQGAANFQSTSAFGGNMDVNADMDVSGNAQVGSLNVTANADIDGTFDAAGAANFQNTLTVAGIVDINNAMDVSGSATVGSLNVTANADLDGTLDVASAATVNALNVTNNADIDGTLDVALGANFQNTLTAAGHVDINSTMDVSGTATLNALNVSVDSNLIGALTVTGASVLKSTLDVQGTATANALNVTNNADIDGTLNIQGVASFQDDLVVDSDKFVVDQSTGFVGIGKAVPAADLDMYKATGSQAVNIVSGDANAVLKLQAANTGFSKLNFADGDSETVGQIRYNHVTNLMKFSTNGTQALRIDSAQKAWMDGALDVAGLSAFAADVDINAAMDVSGNAQVGSLNVTANADIDGTLDIQGAANFQSTSAFAADVDINAAMDVSGNAQVGSLNVTANADIDGTLDIQGNANFQSTSVFAANMDVNAALDVSGNAQVGSLNVTANADIDGTFDAAGAANLQSTLTVAGNADLNGTLDVDGNAQVGSLNTTANADIGAALDVVGVATFASDLAVDTDTLFVDVSEDRVGINNAAPAVTLHLTGTDGLVIPVGTNAQRTDVVGAIRYNTDNSTFEGYKGTWGSLGGVVDVDQDTKITAEDSAGADNDQLRFYTFGSERMTINKDGSLDIMGASDQVGAANFQSTSTFAGNMDLNAALDVSGNAQVGSLNTTANADIGANLDVVGTANFQSTSAFAGNMDVNADMDVSGTAQINALNVTNNADINGTLDIQGTANFQSTSAFADAVDINAALDVSGTAQIAALNVTGNADVDGTLNTAGIATFQNQVVVTGDLDVNNSADFSGAVVMQSTLQVDGNMSSLSNGFNVKDYSGVARMSLGTADAEASIHIEQEGANLILQNTSASGTAELKFKNVLDQSTFQIGMDDAGSVAYISEQNGNPIVMKINDVEKVRLDANGNMGIGKTALSGNRLGLAGNMNVDTGNAYKVANAIVLNASKLGDAVFNSSLKVVGELTSLSVSGATQLKDTLVVTGALTANSDVDVNAAIDVSGNAQVGSLNVTANADIDGTLDVQLNANFQATSAFAGDVDINADIDVSGNAQVGSLNCTANADVDGTLDVQGSVNFQDDLAVDTDTLFVDASADRVGINTATPAYELEVIGSGKFSANLIIDGNLTVQGTSTTMNTEVVTIEDPLISLGANNSADAVDLGFYSKYNDGADKWTGLFRDASSSGEYSLFDGSTAEPSTVVDTANAGYGLATLNLDELKGTTINASTELIGAALKITGNADLDGTLNVSLASTLQSTLEVQSSATVNSLVVTNNADLNGALDVAGTAQINILNVTGNTDIDGTLNVAQLSTLDSLLVTNNGTVSGDLLVSLNTTLAGGLRVDTDTLVVDASGNKVGINITNPDNELDVNGVIQARNDMVVQGNLIIKGTNASSGDLNAIWAENIYGEGYLLKSAMGIGITNPQYEVDVVGDINLTGDLYQNGAVVSLAGNVIQTNGTNAYYNAGNFGLGTNAPTNGKLEVVGDYGSVGLSSNAYNDMDADSIGLGDAGTFSYSIYASGKVAGSSFHAVSDARVKNIVSERNNEDDKLAIEKLNVYNYKYIDQPAYGKQTKIGIMAQDVEAIHSDIIEEQQKFIPNIYKECRLNSVNEVQIGNCDIVKGDLVKIQYKVDKEFLMCEKEVLSFEDGVMTLSAQDEDNSFATDSAFVYGKRINDFKSVNFEQLTSLNTSAIKAIIQENKDLKAELAAIKEFIGM